MRGFGLLAVLGLVFSCHAFALVENVFTPDGRTPVLGLSEPSRWVGKLRVPVIGGRDTEANCTAALVYGDLILTAAHCIIDPRTGALRPGSFIFHYGYVNGVSTAQASVYWLDWGTDHPARHRLQDWAIGRLSHRLGDRFGWLPVVGLDVATHLNDRSLVLIGYSGDYRGGRVATQDLGCSFRGVDGSGLALHDCDSTRGASGAPMIRITRSPDGSSTYQVVGLNVAERRDTGEASLVGIEYGFGHANLAVPAGQFLLSLQNQISAESE